jgi:hydroxymethylglutaryl-CoA lyase
MTEHVSICEVGPRDGLQIAKTRMGTDAKVGWIRAIAAAGVKEIEVGSFVPPRVIPQLSDTPEVVEQCLRIPGLIVQALAPNLRGVQNAYHAGVHKISIPVSVSEGHSMANLNRMPAQSITMMQEIMDWLKAQPRHVPVVAGCSTAFGCSIDGVVPTANTVALAKGLADAGVDQIMLADTVGYAHPAQIREVVRATHEAIGDTLYGLHLHDTCGLGIANALAGLEEGIRAFDACLAGLGGCPYAPGASGNVVTEDLVFMLESMGFATGIDLAKLIGARRLLHEACRPSLCMGRCRRRGYRALSGRRPDIHRSRVRTTGSGRPGGGEPGAGMQWVPAMRQT